VVFLMRCPGDAAGGDGNWVHLSLSGSAGRWARGTTTDSYPQMQLQHSGYLYIRIYTRPQTKPSAVSRAARSSVIPSPGSPRFQLEPVDPPGPVTPPAVNWTQWAGGPPPPPLGELATAGQISARSAEDVAWSALEPRPAAFAGMDLVCHPTPSLTWQSASRLCTAPGGRLGRGDWDPSAAGG
jgi:hypothetical protein